MNHGAVIDRANLSSGRHIARVCIAHLFGNVRAVSRRCRPALRRIALHDDTESNARQRTEHRGRSA